jgi:hypothetical protein
MSGTISGTPTNTGTSNFTVTVTDALFQSATKAFSLTISPAPPPLTITTTSPLPDAEVGKSYNKTLNRSGGVPPFIWSVAPALPAELSLNPSLDTLSAKITGTPAEGTAGTYSLTFTVQDSSTPTPQTDSKVLSLKIKP